jgi:hypothetical protein
MTLEQKLAAIKASLQEILDLKTTSPAVVLIAKMALKEIK